VQSRLRAPTGTGIATGDTITTDIAGKNTERG